LDVFGGKAWLGIVPFRITNVAPRGVPSIPWVSEFPELNVRTYVRVDDRPGIYFFSLNASSALAVQAARNTPEPAVLLGLYDLTSQNESVQYESRRATDTSDVSLSVTYRPVGALFQAVSGTVEYFLTERYCLYNLDHAHAPYRLEIHHPPWSLQAADARFMRNTMADAAGLTLPDVKPLLHFSKRQDMVAWAPTAL
jgi:uncharacterized protein